MLTIKTEAVKEISVQGPQTREPESLAYDYLVVCTGSEYSAPIKVASVLTLEERKSSLQDCHYDTSSVLVVGGGTNGVEIASELRASRLGIVSRGPRLLPGLPHSASQAAEEYMR